MLGIAISNTKNMTGNNTSATHVFLYYTEAASAQQGNMPLGNRLYRYELNNNKLVNPRLLDLPAIPGPRHNGGAIIIGPDNNLPVPIGDVNSACPLKLENNINGGRPQITGRAYSG